MQLITRLDFDGLVCAAMLYEVERIEELNFTNPKDLEEGRMPFGLDFGDAIAHLPFHSYCRLWFHNRDFEDIPAQKLEGVRGTGVLEKRDGKWVLVQLHYSIPARS